MIFREIQLLLGLYFTIPTCILQILETQAKVAEKKELYRPYNVLPLDPDSQNQAIMRYPEVNSIIVISVSDFFLLNLPAYFAKESNFM